MSRRSIENANSAGERNQPSGEEPSEPLICYVVDESWSVRNSLKRLLRSYGFRAFTFASGSECLERIGRDRPDCAIIDTALPDVTPRELLQRLGKAAPSVRLLVMSALSDAEFHGDFASAGAEAVLCKPIEQRNLLAQLEKVTGRDIRKSRY